MKNIIKTADHTGLPSADYLRVALDTTENKVYYLHSVSGGINSEAVSDETETNTVIPDNQIWYTTSDGSLVTFAATALSLTVVSNIYENGKGVATFSGNVGNIGPYAFQTTGITSITLPHSITGLNDYAFLNCSTITSIIYNGTMSEWNSLSKGNYADEVASGAIVTCTDGQMYTNGMPVDSDIISNQDLITDLY